MPQKTFYPKGKKLYVSKLELAIELPNSPNIKRDNVY